jgi:hypothetical protein
MRPGLRAAIADFAATATADLSRWAHRVGVTDCVLGNDTPTRNAIGPSSPVGITCTLAVGELSPWRSNLPPPGGGKSPGIGLGMCAITISILQDPGVFGAAALARIDDE